MHSEPTVELPDELIAGVSATWLGVWHTPYELVLDFAVQKREGAEEAADFRSVSRVGIPVGFAFEALDIVRRGVTKYEGVYGEIVRPRRYPDGE